MLRCTVAGLIPLINSRKYANRANVLFQENQQAFAKIIQHKSYYLLRSLPGQMARSLLIPVLPNIKRGQMKNGLWRGKNPWKSTYTILSACNHAGIGYTDICRYFPFAGAGVCDDEYALLTKRLLEEPFIREDSQALATLIQAISDTQDENGSFGQTVTGTVIHMRRLLDLGMPQDDPVILHGAEYLLTQRKPSLQGMHTTMPYSLTVADVFTTEDRYAEFQAALTYKPEWIPRQPCFHTLAIIPNAVCLTLLLQLGMEEDPGVSAALTSLYTLYQRHGGFCATNIKKPYLPS